MKEGSLVFFIPMRYTEPGMLQIAFLVSLESSEEEEEEEGCIGFRFMVFGLVVSKFLNIE
jgi:hypothetical protein